MEPREIAIIVHGAKNLQGKKKGRHKYNVIFGVGNNRYRTGVEQEPSGNPTWAEESLIEVDNPQHPLVFIVREKEDILGQVSVPLSCIPPEDRRGKRKFPLQPHRKSPNPQGELVFEAWVTKCKGDGTIGNTGVTTPAQEPPSIRVTCEPAPPHSPSRTNPLKALKETIQRSPIMARRSAAKAAKSTMAPALVRRNSRSLQDLSELKTEMKSSLSAGSQPVGSGSTSNSKLLLGVGSNKGELSKRCNSSVDVSSSGSSSRPEITSVIPPMGTVDGGTVLTIGGRNLGTNKEDVVGLFICGANCLGSLEYCSPEKLRCVTKGWRVCRGYIVVETQTGGRGTSLVQYTFKELTETDGKTEEEGTEGSLVRRKSPSTPEPNRKIGLLARLSSPEPREKESKKVKTQTAQELADMIRGKQTSGGVHSTTTPVAYTYGYMDSPSKIQYSFRTVNTDLRSEIKVLKEENSKLREQNDTLKLYVDHLVARVMEECPEALCASAASAAVALATR